MNNMKAVDGPSGVSIVMLTHGLRARTEEAVGHVTRQAAAGRYPIELVLVERRGEESGVSPKANVSFSVVTHVADGGTKLAALNSGIARARHDCIVYLSSEWAVEPGWLDEAVTAHAARFGADGAGLTALNDGFQQGRCACAGLAHKSLAARIGGRLMHEGYEEFYGDVELTQSCKALGLLAYAEKARIRRLNDPGEELKKDPEIARRMSADERLYLRRRRAAFGLNELEKVLAPVDEDIHYRHVAALHAERLGNVQEAIDAFGVLLTLPTDDAQWFHAAAHAHLARLFAATGVKYDPAAHAAACSRLNPNDRRASPYLAEWRGGNGV